MWSRGTRISVEPCSLSHCVHVHTLAEGLAVCGMCCVGVHLVPCTDVTQGGTLLHFDAVH